MKIRGRAADTSVDVTALVPGDVVRLAVGDVVPGDLRLLEANELECDEGVLTGESAPTGKNVAATTKPESPLDLPSCAFMGTVVRSGNGVGVVVQTGGRTTFGKIARRLGEQRPQTAFQLGLRDFSLLLVRVAGLLAGTILIVNIALGRSVIESTLFALSISIPSGAVSSGSACLNRFAPSAARRARLDGGGRAQ